MNHASWLHPYIGMGTLLLPVSACGAIGGMWGLKKRAYPGEFISVLTTAVITPA